ncbi:hypothetical protein K438DRAFT_1985331 [Mycena galopus ATCC 62051]|nr:hypothetical protein K438DRAFT_1985331 [Mycena galopus ATCC 62051]
MSSPYQCSPPFHPDPGDTRAQATSFNLVSSPAVLENRGTHTSCAQHVCENIPPVGATKFSSWEACLPVWHACCDAGEHAHPSSPTIPVCLEPPRTPKTQAHCTTAAHTPCTPTTATSVSPSTVSTLSATGATFSVYHFAHANPPPHPLDQKGCEQKLIPGSRSPSPPPLEALRCGPRTLPPALDPPLNATQTYVIHGSGTIHTSLDDTLADFNITAARGQATLCATDNPRVATHVAAGHTLEEARALVCLGNLGGQVLKEEYAYDCDNEYWHDS